ncbi:MAG: major capsid protein [Isosphaeraceae bacterium]|nr:major capsid protein [Isosphaeraceae bacterium]
MATAIYDYPKSAEIEKVEQVLLPRLTARSPLFELFPFDAATGEGTLLKWEQMDSYTDLQQYRGYGGQPRLVNQKKINQYISYPGVYGEKQVIDEEQLTTRRIQGTWGEPVPINDLVGQSHEQLLTRRIDLIEWIISKLLVTGAFNILSGTGGSTVYSGSFTAQQFTSSVAWSTLATATPLADFRAIKPFEFGQSVTFGADAIALMNVVTANQMLNNSNAADLGGKRGQYGATINSLEDWNKILVMNDLPRISIYNGGYLNETGTFQLFIPTGYVLVVGKRTTGRRMGYYRFTRNIHSPNMAAAPYVRVKMEEDVPSFVEVHDGHNGGPVLQFPGTIVVMNVSS